MFDFYSSNIAYSRPESYYFWGYYFFMNFFWIVIPGSELYLPLIPFPYFKNLCSAVLK